MSHRRLSFAAGIFLAAASCAGNDSSGTTGESTGQTSGGGADGGTGGIAGAGAAGGAVGAGTSGGSAAGGGGGGAATGGTGGAANGGAIDGAGGEANGGGPIQCDGEANQDGTVASVEKSVASVTTDACCHLGLDVCFSNPGGPDNYPIPFWCKKGIPTDTLPSQLDPQSSCEPSKKFGPDLAPWGSLYCCGLHS